MKKIMKKTLIFILNIILCISVTSCARMDGVINDKRENDNQNLDTEINEQTDHSLSEDCTPVIIEFDSFNDICELINVADKSSEAIEEYIDIHYEGLLISSEDIREAAEEISAFNIPKIKNSKRVNYLSSSYYSNRKELTLFYEVDGIRYRFTYRKTENYGQRVNEGKLLLKNVLYGDSTIDIYLYEDVLGGYKLSEEIEIMVCINSTDTSLVSKEMFNMFSFQKIIGYETEMPQIETDQKTETETATETETNAEESEEDNHSLEKEYTSGGFSKDIQVSLLSALDSYVSTDSVSEYLLGVYKEADSVKSVPILGTYLEETPFVLYVFYKGNAPCSTAMLEFNSKGEPLDIEVVEFAKSDISEYPYVDAHSNADCYGMIDTCYKIMPDFEVLGVSLSNAGYPMSIPIGRCKGETVIKYFLGSPTYFNLVEPFDSIEKGRALYAKYWDEKNYILSQLPIYSWKAEEFYVLGYWNMYQLEYIYHDEPESKEKILPFVEAHDSMTAIPLLDENFAENVVITHLLYYRNQLLGEVVIDFQRGVMAVYYNLAEMGADGSYIPLGKSEYQKAIEKAGELYPDIEIEGVVFKEGKYMPFGHSGDEIVYLVE